MSRLKSILISVGLAIACVGCGQGKQKDAVPQEKDAVITEPILIKDLSPGAPDPRNFRLATDLEQANPKPKLDLTGLDTLRASGSSEFSSAGLAAVLKRIETACPDPRPTVYVFDLRQEFHGHLDGVPVSWYGMHDWANKGKTHEQVVTEEKALLAATAKEKSVRIAEEADAKKLGDAAPRTTLEFTRVQSEEEIVGAQGARYVRITVTDMMGPTPKEVDRFVEAVRQLPAGAWAHFHCHAGRGRTTTFLILHDMLRNAPRVSLEEIVARQGALADGPAPASGAADEPDFNLLKLDYDQMPEWKRQPARDRADFIRRFYEFAAKAEPLQKKVQWSDWSAGTAGK